MFLHNCFVLIKVINRCVLEISQKCGSRWKSPECLCPEDLFSHQYCVWSILYNQYLYEIFLITQPVVAKIFLLSLYKIYCGYHKWMYRIFENPFNSNMPQFSLGYSSRLTAPALPFIENIWFTTGSEGKRRRKTYEWEREKVEVRWILKRFITWSFPFSEWQIYIHSAATKINTKSFKG